MRSLWMRFLLLGTFLFWGTGTARHVHETLEHHGHDLAVDDDDSVLFPAMSQGPAPLQDHSNHHPSHECPVCQMLASMIVHPAAPPALPPPLPLLETVMVVDHLAPAIPPCLSQFARGPPVFTSLV